jgi:hypothetical protein
MNVVHVVAVLSLYCHVLVVMLPVDESVNVTFNGASPVVGLAVNPAIGGGVVTDNSEIVYVFRLFEETYCKMSSNLA